MKLILSLIAVTALTISAQFVRAQEEETASPAPATEEPTSPTVEAPSATTETPAVTMPEKSAAPATAVAPAKKEPAATSSSPSADKKKTEAATTGKTAASTKVSAGPDSGSPESNVKRLEGEWENAVMKHDISFLQARVAEDFIGCSSKGKRMNKAALLKETKSDADTYSSAKNGSIMVRSYGANVVVANGTSKEVGKGKDGAPFNRTFAWTDTWMLRGKTWQCIASQSMLVAGK